jgi:hypothetical protein
MPTAVTARCAGARQRVWRGSGALAPSRRKAAAEGCARWEHTL